jgi:hypothetical protein
MTFRAVAIHILADAGTLERETQCAGDAHERIPVHRRIANLVEGLGGLHQAALVTEGPKERRTFVT